LHFFASLYHRSPVFSLDYTTEHYRTTHYKLAVTARQVRLDV